jgi:SPRY domain
MVSFAMCCCAHTGVCTAAASVSTYVGGDRYGWGLIGTRALWHNRTKLKSDYGDGFLSGNAIRCTLDTDRGTLAFALDAGAGVVDWGVAFDNLPRTEKLYPAVGLYARDDQVRKLRKTLHLAQCSLA